MSGPLDKVMSDSCQELLVGSSLHCQRGCAYQPGSHAFTSTRPFSHSGSSWLCLLGCSCAVYTSFAQLSATFLSSVLCWWFVMSLLMCISPIVVFTGNGAAHHDDVEEDTCV